MLSNVSAMSPVVRHRFPVVGPQAHGELVPQSQMPKTIGRPEARMPSRISAYSAAGGIVGGTLFDAGPESDPAAAGAALAELLDDPAVALVHARALEFGCFTFEVRRAA